jgi:hypothetical protein
VFSTADDMGKFLSFLLRAQGAVRDDTPSANQPLDAATVRRWLGDRVMINPSNLNCTHCMYYTSWGVPWQNLRAEMSSDPRMSGFSRYSLLSKDGSVPGYNAQLVLQPELNVGLFTAMTVGPGGRADVPFFSDTLSLLNFEAIPPLHAWLARGSNNVPPTVRLPPMPSDYLGNYTMGGGGTWITVGRQPQGPWGDAVLYILDSGCVERAFPHFLRPS